MKTPYLPLFHLMPSGSKRLSAAPFVPAHKLPFAAADCTVYYEFPGGWLCYRWHDAFNVFVAVLEIKSRRDVSIPIESYLKDLHLVYQLHGDSVILAPSAKVSTGNLLRLAEGHHMPVYTPPAKGVLQANPDPSDGRYALAAVVPKGDWLTRYPTQTNSPMEDLIGLLKARYAEYRHLHPEPISPEIRAWLQLLFSTPKLEGMALDHALNRPMIELVETHRAEFLRQERNNEDEALVKAARLLAAALIARMDGGQVPNMVEIADSLDISERRLRELYQQHCGQRFVHHIQACRMEEAQKRLLGDLPISAIAYQLGWTEPANFSIDFKKHTGHTPSEYREQHLK